MASATLVPGGNGSASSCVLGPFVTRALIPTALVAGASNPYLAPIDSSEANALFPASLSSCTLAPRVAPDVAYLSVNALTATTTQFDNFDHATPALPTSSTGGPPIRTTANSQPIVEPSKTKSEAQSTTQNHAPAVSTAINSPSPPNIPPPAQTRTLGPPTSLEPSSNALSSAQSANNASPGVSPNPSGSAPHTIPEQVFPVFVTLGPQGSSAITTLSSPASQPISEQIFPVCHHGAAERSRVHDRVTDLGSQRSTRQCQRCTHQSRQHRTASCGATGSRPSDRGQSWSDSSCYTNQHASQLGCGRADDCPRCCSNHCFWTADKLSFCRKYCGHWH